MATHSRILAWEISWTEESGRLQSPWGCKESDTTERLYFHFTFKLLVEESQGMSKSQQEVSDSAF